MQFVSPDFVDQHMQNCADISSRQQLTAWIFHSRRLQGLTKVFINCAEANNEKWDVCDLGISPLEYYYNLLGNERRTPVRSSTSSSTPAVNISDAQSSFPFTSSSATTSVLPFVSDAIVGQAEARGHSAYAHNLCATIEKVGNRCLLCNLVDVQVLLHPVTDCHHVKHKYSRCLSPNHGINDFARSCKVQLPKGFCFGCGLPSYIGKMKLLVLQPQPFKTTCDHPLRDKLMPPAF
jgi:hypothetical protein